MACDIVSFQQMKKCINGFTVDHFELNDLDKIWKASIVGHFDDVRLL